MARASRKSRDLQRRASLLARWSRIRLSVQGTQGHSLVCGDPACHGATKPGLPAAEPEPWSPGTAATSPRAPELVLSNKHARQRGSSPRSRQRE